MTEVTVEDIKAMRTAESVSFHKVAGQRETTIVLRCAVGRGRFQTVTEIQLSADTRVTDYSIRYDESGERPSDEDYACHDSHVWHAVWQTAVESIKPGDVLQIEWVRGNDSPATLEAGAHTDELRLNVIHRGKRPTGVFLLGYSVTAGASIELCRMVRSPRRQYALVSA